MSTPDPNTPAVVDDVDDADRYDPILKVFADITKPEALERYGAEFAEMIRAVEEHRGTGKATFTVTVKPYGTDIARAVVTAVDFTTKPPRPPASERVRFAAEGRLHQDDPHQGAIPGIRSVD